jgi:alpha-L-arabinofuranosidase
MKHLRLFEDFKGKFEDNKPVVSALKKILSCLKSGKELSSKLNGGTLIDLHDKCSDKKVMMILKKAADIILKEEQGKKVDLSKSFDEDKLNAIITVLDPQKKKSKKSGMKMESFSNFTNESHTKSVHITDDEMNLFSDEPALQELITNKKITLKDGEVLFDENDEETKQLLDQYLEMPGKV